MNISPCELLQKELFLCIIVHSIMITAKLITRIHRSIYTRVQERTVCLVCANKEIVSVRISENIGLLSAALYNIDSLLSFPLPAGAAHIPNLCLLSGSITTTE